MKTMLIKERLEAIMVICNELKGGAGIEGIRDNAKSALAEIDGHIEKETARVRGYRTGEKVARILIPKSERSAVVVSVVDDMLQVVSPALETRMMTKDTEEAIKVARTGIEAAKSMDVIRKEKAKEVVAEATSPDTLVATGVLTAEERKEVAETVEKKKRKQKLAHITPGAEAVDDLVEAKPEVIAKPTSAGEAEDDLSLLLEDIDL